MSEGNDVNWVEKTSNQADWKKRYRASETAKAVHQEDIADIFSKDEPHTYGEASIALDKALELIGSDVKAVGGDRVVKELLPEISKEIQVRTLTDLGIGSTSFAEDKMSEQYAPLQKTRQAVSETLQKNGDTGRVNNLHSQFMESIVASMDESATLLATHAKQQKAAAIS